MSNRLETKQKNVDKIMEDVDQIIQSGGYDIKEHESEANEQKETKEADPQVVQVVRGILEREDINDIFLPEEIDVAIKVLDDPDNPTENLSMTENELLHDALGKLKDSTQENEQEQVRQSETTRSSDSPGSVTKTTTQEEQQSGTGDETEDSDQESADTKTQNTTKAEQQLPQESVEKISRSFMKFLEEEKKKVEEPDTPEEKELYKNAPESYKNFMMFTRAVERLANQPEVPSPYKQTISSNLSTLAEMPPKPEKDFKKYADAAEAIITAMDNFTHPNIREATREHISEIFSPELADYMSREGYSIATKTDE